MEEIRSDPRFGSNPAEHIAFFATYRRYANALSGISTLAMFWAFLYPHPYVALILVLAILPWIACLLAQRSRGLIRTDEKPKQVRPAITTAIIGPAVGLALRAVSDMNVVQNGTLWLLSLGIAGVLLAWLCVVDPGLRKTPLTASLIFLFLTGYGYGAVVQADVLLDTKPGRFFQASVTGKQESHSRGSSYHLQLSPWGPFPAGDELDVDKETFNATPAGRSVTLNFHDGLLRIPWYSLVAE